MRHDEGWSIAVLPEHNPSHSPPSNIRGVVLGPEETILNSLVPWGPGLNTVRVLIWVIIRTWGSHTVPVTSPGKDLDPANEVVRKLRVGTSGQTDSVASRIGNGDSLHSHVERVWGESSKLIIIEIIKYHSTNFWFWLIWISNCPLVGWERRYGEAVCLQKEFHDQKCGCFLHPPLSVLALVIGALNGGVGH